jgi:branched-chain amino acid transport system permease protein
MSYNLVYQSSGVFNFAQGDLLTYGGLITFTLVLTHGWAVLAAVIPVMAAVGAIGLLQERITIAPILRRTGGASSVAWIVTTLGASVVLENIAQLVWGSTPEVVPNFISGRPLTIFGAPVPKDDFLIVAVAVAVGIALELWSRRTMFGKAWRALAEDSGAASARGIPVRRVAIIVFVAAAAISGLGGFITVPLTGAYWSTGALLSLNAFVAIALGGFGSQAGALVGSFLLGVTQSLVAVAVDPGYNNVIAFGLLILILLIRPSGIFGEPQERRV